MSVQPVSDSTPNSDAPSQVTRLLRDWQQGDADAASELATVIHGELRRLAVQRLRTLLAPYTANPNDALLAVQAAAIAAASASQTTASASSSSSVEPSAWRAGFPGWRRDA